MSTPSAPQGTGRDSRLMADHPDVAALGARFDQIVPTMTTNFVHGLMLLAGAYVAISPWVIGFNGQSAMVTNNVIIGLSVALLAYGYTAAFERTRGLAWTSVVFGIWLIVAPWVMNGIDRTTGVLVSNIITGAVIALLGCAMAGMWMLSHQRSRGSQH